MSIDPKLGDLMRRGQTRSYRIWSACTCCGKERWVNVGILTQDALCLPCTQAIRRYGVPHTYGSVHRGRVVRLGTASSRICACGFISYGWSLQTITEHTLWGADRHGDRHGRGYVLPYSLDDQDYQAECRSCCRRTDKRIIAQWNFEQGQLYGTR